MFPPRLELGTFRVLGERDNHYTTETLDCCSWGMVLIWMTCRLQSYISKMCRPIINWLMLFLYNAIWSNNMQYADVRNKRMNNGGKTKIKSAIIIPFLRINFVILRVIYSIFSRPYRYCYTVVSVCLSSVTLCIVAKRCVLEQSYYWEPIWSRMRNRLVPKWMTLTFV